jgi:excinuclease ABC subunit C
VLDAIPGIGALKKKALLMFFGDLRNIKEASVDELQKVEGIGRHMAEQIHTFVKEMGGDRRE